jgi:hypothetical protein
MQGTATSRWDLVGGFFGDSMTMSIRFTAASLTAALAAFAFPGVHAQTVIQGAEVTPAAYSAQLPSLANAPILKHVEAEEPKVKEVKQRPLRFKDMVADSAVQGQPSGTNAAVTPGLGFDGVGVGLAGYQPNSAPPDTTGAVGATQYVQWVNTDFAVFDKSSGALLYGPVPGNTLFQNLGGACATSNDGDPIVQYDKAAGRWVLSQFAVPGGSAGYWQCVAVSKTSDATGGWNTYAFPAPNFNDYPKMGVWSDGYYVTFNMFTSSFVGARVCAYDRASMIAGTAATQQCFQLSTAYDSLLPADIDGLTAPPVGSPNYLVALVSGHLGMWKAHIDWSNAGASSLAGPTAIATAAYNLACNGGTCVPQSGTKQKLDSLGDRLMFRLAYRNLGGTETMVVNHSVMVNATRRRGSGNSAVRWYEIRNMATTPSVFQQSSFSPDTKYRWMGSAAMDKQGNMAVGYSVSSSTTHPALAYATRLAGDAAGSLSGETTVVAGAGSQLSNLARWGDYTHMSVDPMDDCTFWYTGQYLKANGTFNWSTRIVSFKIASCS